MIIQPSEPRPHQDLELTYDYYDPDGDPEQGSLIQWYRNGGRQSGYDNLSTLPYVATNAGEIWYAMVRPRNNQGLWGNWAISNIVRISSVIADWYYGPGAYPSKQLERLPVVPSFSSSSSSRSSYSVSSVSVSSSSSSSSSGVSSSSSRSSESLSESYYFLDVAFKSTSAYVFATAISYASGNPRGVVSIDVDDPSNPSIVGWLAIDPTVYGGVKHCQITGSGYLAVSLSEWGGSISGGVILVNITDPTSMSLMGKYSLGDPATYNTNVNYFDVATLTGPEERVYLATADTSLGLVAVDIDNPNSLTKAGDYVPGTEVLDVAVTNSNVVVITNNRVRFLYKNDGLTLQSEPSLTTAPGTSGSCPTCTYTSSKATGFNDTDYKVLTLSAEAAADVVYVTMRALPGPGSTLWAVSSGGVNSLAPISFGTLSDLQMVVYFNTGVYIAASTGSRTLYSCDSDNTLDYCDTPWYMGMNCGAPTPSIYLDYPVSKDSKTQDILGLDGGIVSATPYIFCACMDEGLRIYDVTDISNLSLEYINFGQ